MSFIRPLAISPTTTACGKGLSRPAESPPGPRHLAKLIAEAKRQNVKVIFVEPQFDEKSARAMAEAIGGAVVPLDPLGENYMKNMEKIAESIAKSLK